MAIVYSSENNGRGVKFTDCTLCLKAYFNINRDTFEIPLGIAVESLNLRKAHSTSNKKYNTGITILKNVGAELEDGEAYDIKDNLKFALARQSPVDASQSIDEDDVRGNKESFGFKKREVAYQDKEGL